MAPDGAAPDGAPRLPRFEVPLGVDVAAEDTPRNAEALKRFVEALAAGVSLDLEVHGAGVLTVAATLERDHSELVLGFNSVTKTVALRKVRSVTLREVSGGSRRVVLDIDGDLYCTFVFQEREHCSEEASYLAGCLRLLADGARFEAARKELAELNSAGDDDGSAEEAVGLNGRTLTSADAPAGRPTFVLNPSRLSAVPGGDRGGVNWADEVAAALEALEGVDADADGDHYSRALP